MSLGAPSPRESEGLFRLVADSLPLLVWISGSDKRCTYFNKPWLDFTGRPLESEIGDGWTDGVHAADRQHCLDTHSRAFDLREPFMMEYRLRRHDGEYRWVLDNAAPLFDSHGSFAGYIGACVDVTEFRRAEAERNVARDRLRLAMESGHSVGWDWDLRTNRVNRFGDLSTGFGMSSDPAVGSIDDFRRWMHPEDRDRVWKALKDAMEGRSPCAAEFRIVWPNGTVRWMTAKGQFFYSPGGDPERMLGMAVDISERKDAEESLRRKEMELKESQRLAGVGGWQWESGYRHGRVVRGALSHRRPRSTLAGPELQGTRTALYKRELGPTAGRRRNGPPQRRTLRTRSGDGPRRRHAPMAHGTRRGAARFH